MVRIVFLCAWEPHDTVAKMNLLGLETTLSYLLLSKADTSERPQMCETARVSHLATQVIQKQC